MEKFMDGSLDLLEDGFNPGMKFWLDMFDGKEPRFEDALMGDSGVWGDFTDVIGYVKRKEENGIGLYMPITEEVLDIQAAEEDFKKIAPNLVKLTRIFFDKLEYQAKSNEWINSLGDETRNLLGKVAKIYLELRDADRVSYPKIITPIAFDELYKEGVAVTTHNVIDGKITYKAGEPYQV